MKSMLLVSGERKIPMKIIELASKVNDMVGDMNISVEISDEDIGVRYSILPNCKEFEKIEERTEPKRQLLGIAR